MAENTIFSTYSFFSYCYWCTCYGHSNTTTVTLSECLLTTAHSETISIKKFEHYSFVLCHNTYFQHILFFHTATGALSTVICRRIILLISVFFSFESLNSYIIQILSYNMIKFSI